MPGLLEVVVLFALKVLVAAALFFGVLVVIVCSEGWYHTLKNGVMRKRYPEPVLCYGKSPDLIEWLHHNHIPHWLDGDHIRFRTAADAVVFKLRWL